MEGHLWRVVGSPRPGVPSYVLVTCIALLGLEISATFHRGLQPSFFSTSLCRVFAPSAATLAYAKGQPYCFTAKTAKATIWTTPMLAKCMLLPETWFARRVSLMHKVGTPMASLTWSEMGKPNAAIFSLPVSHLRQATLYIFPALVLKVGIFPLVADQHFLETLSPRWMKRFSSSWADLLNLVL